MVRSRHCRRYTRNGAFTILDFLIVIVVVVLAAAFALPFLARAKVGGGPLCSSNQKQIGLAFLIFANDHQEKFPMQLRVADGGTMGLPMGRQPLATFAALSNELNNPKSLKCPQDTKRARATDFSHLTVANLSYFLSVDASVTNFASILIGDRNLRINWRPTRGLLEVTNAQTVSWGNGIHVAYGYVTLADGSVHRATDPLLQKALQDSGVATNRLAIP